MDPITAIGLASNVLSFIDYGAKIVSGAVEIYQSSSGLTDSSRGSKAIVTEMRLLASKLQPPAHDQLSGDEKSLCNLATECDSLSEQIIDLIEKVEPKNRKSKGSSLRAAVKTKWYESDRRRLEDRLNQCRAQLNLQLNYLTSSEIKTRVDGLIASAKDDSSKLEQISNQLDSMRKGSTVSSLSPDAQAQLHSLWAVSEHADNLIAQQRILATLRFDGMYQRYEDVAEAHAETFAWIFTDKAGTETPSNTGSDADDPSIEDTYAEDQYVIIGKKKLDDEDEAPPPPYTSLASEDAPKEAIKGLERIGSWTTTDDTSTPLDLVPPPSSVAVVDRTKAAAKESLAAWLSSGNGIFHLSGKLGSGKSTLMKFLCEHELARTKLEAWAAPRKLVFASFFFWRPGSALQKSLTGLFQSLLHDVLQASPELIPVVLSEVWGRVKSMPWQAINDIRLSGREIRQAFSRLILDTSIYKDHCFCFFIDGLDEYEGTLQDDTRSLVDLLRNWTATAPDSVKMCVSSREHNVFMNAFSADKRIRLHEVTRSDMILYVTSKLGPVDQKDDEENLVDTIVDNAEGIFLWVALVVKRIREQIENGRTASDLRREIGTLPKEMDGLLLHILDSLADADLREAYQVFAMVMVLQKQALSSLPILSYSFLDQYNQNSEFALQDNFPHARLEPDHLVKRTKAALKRVNGCCKGFVETSSQIDGKPPDYPSDIDKIGSGITFTHRSIPEFLSSDARKDRMERLLEGFDASDAASNLALAGLLADPLMIARQGRLIRLLIPVRAKKHLDHEPFLYLDALCEAVVEARNLVPESEIKRTASAGIDSIVSQHAYVTVCEEEKTLWVPVATCFDTNRLSAAGIHRPQHPLYQAAFFGNCEFVRWKLTHDASTRSQISMEILLNCLIKSDADIPIREVKDTVDVLVSLGLTPQASSDITYPEVVAFEKDDPDTALKVQMTNWQQLLLTCYGCTIWALRAKLPRIGYIVEAFLEHDADPYFEIKVNQPTEEKAAKKRAYAPPSHIKSWIWTLTLGKDRREMLLYYMVIPWNPYEFEAACLSDYVLLFNFENESRILELIKRNERMFNGLPAEIEASALPGQDLGRGLTAPGELESPASGSSDERRSKKDLAASVMTSEKPSAHRTSIPRFGMLVSVLVFGIVLAMTIQWRQSMGR